MAVIRSRRLVAAFVAIALGVGLAGSLDPSFAVGASSPPQPCAPKGTGASPIICPKLAVNPTTNLVDLQEVTLHGRKYTAGGQVVTIECSILAAQVGQDACDLGTDQFLTAGPDGRFTLKRYVRRLLSTASGNFDCAIAPNTCIMAAANFPNYLEAAGVALSFDPNVPPIVPSLFAVPDTGLVDHQVIKVFGTGVIPNTGVQLAECQAAAQGEYPNCDYSTFAFLQASPTGHFSGELPVQRILDLQGGPYDCAIRPGACQFVMENSSGLTSAPLAFNRNKPPAAQTLSVSPTTPLKDHQLVTLHGTGFTPGATVSVLQCQTMATGIGPCDYATQSFTTPNLNGQFHITYPVHRILSLFTGKLDCASAAKACTLVASNVQRQESASKPVRFDPKSPPVTTSLTVTPNTGLHDNESVVVKGTGFTPFASVQVVQCGKEAVGGNLGYCSSSPYGGTGGVAVQTDRHGDFSVNLFVHRTVGTQGGLIDCTAKPGACVVGATRFSSLTDTRFVSISFS